MAILRRRRNTGRSRPPGERGFSMVETMVSTGVLGIGLAALIRLTGTTADSLADNRHHAEAHRIAQQRLEQLATQRPDVLLLPTCPLSGAALGCREDRTRLTATKACTTWVDGPALPSATGSPAPTNPTERGYRLDVVIGPHPDTVHQANAFLATVSVCWEEAGRVEEVQLARLLVPGA